MAAQNAGYVGEIAGVKCGLGGLSVNLNPSQISLKNVIVAEGCTFRQDHWRKEAGTALFGTNNASVGDPNDAVIVALVLRSFVRSGGEALVRELWPGPAHSLGLILRLALTRR